MALDCHGAARRNREDGNVANGLSEHTFSRLSVNGVFTFSTAFKALPEEALRRERDAESGLDYFESRYYSANAGRFISPDEFKSDDLTDPYTGRAVYSTPGPLPYAELEDPQSLNKYGYTRNNPLRFTDPDGHFQQEGTLVYKTTVPTASGSLNSMLTCTARCSQTTIRVTSTHEPNERHPASSPHGRGVAADITVKKSAEKTVLGCASACGAKFGLNERIHPSKHANGPHIHLQVVSGKRGGSGDLPSVQPKSNNKTPAKTQ